MNKTPRFFNKNGDLSSYSFACGYVQKNAYSVQLWKEHCCYHISRQTSEGKFIRAATGRLTDARKIYRAWCRADKLPIS